MKNGKLQVAVIGCGGIANQKHFPALKSQSDKCEIVAFCDIIRERAEKGAKEYGTPDAKVYEDYHELLKDSAIDVVHVCTPNVAHCPITVAAFEAGKHVMCEKPMAATTADAQKMMDAWKKSGKKFTIGYQNRFRTDAQMLKRTCEEGKLGDIYLQRHMPSDAVPYRHGAYFRTNPNRAAVLSSISEHTHWILHCGVWITMNRYLSQVQSLKSWDICRKLQRAICSDLGIRKPMKLKTLLSATLKWLMGQRFSLNLHGH